MTPKYNALALREPCTSCGAAISDRCIGVRGERVLHTHWVRRRDAGNMRKARVRARRQMKRDMAMGKIRTVAFLDEHGTLSFA